MAPKKRTTSKAAAEAPAPKMTAAAKRAAAKAEALTGKQVPEPEAKAVPEPADKDVEMKPAEAAVESKGADAAEAAEPAPEKSAAATEEAKPVVAAVEKPAAMEQVADTNGAQEERKPQGQFVPPPPKAMPIVVLPKAAAEAERKPVVVKGPRAMAEEAAAMPAKEDVVMEAAQEDGPSDGGAKAAEGAAATDVGMPAPAPAGELEESAPDDCRQRLTEPVTFHAPDTTMNVMPSTQGGMLMTLNEGGLQYFLAGARASAGMRSGRYMFETRIIEYLNQVEVTGSQARTPVPRNLMRVGVSVAGSIPLLGDTEESFCFDSEGNVLYNRKRSGISQKFGAENVVAVVVNLDERSPNANTISFFKDGQRVVEPQPLPPALQGKVLYPSVTFKNMTVHMNFGPEPYVPLPFGCRMWQDMAREDAVVTAPPVHPNGKSEVLFPLMLPEEGTFDWLDWFLARNPQYTELSDRKVIEWALRSGLWRPKTHSYKSSNDRPDVNFGISHIDDGSVKQILNMIASVQQRDFIVMEVRNSLISEERKELLRRFDMPHFKKVALVMLGEPAEDYKATVHEALLKEKQERSDQDFAGKKMERARKRLIELRQRQVERARKKAERIKRKMDEERRRRMEAEKLAAEKTPEEQVGESLAAAVEGEQALQAPEAEQKEAPKDDDDMEDDEPEPQVEEDETPPKVELTPEEKTEWFRKGRQPMDLSTSVLNASIAKFSLPEESEGFDEVRYAWQQLSVCTEYMRRWVLERKLTTRIEDLQPSDWFREKWQDWQKDLQTWHAKHREYKDPSKRAAMMAARMQQKASEQSVADKENGKPQNAPAEGAKASNAAADRTDKEADEKKDEPMDGKGDKTGAASDGEKKAGEGEKDAMKVDDKAGDAAAKPADAPATKEKDPIEELEEELERQELDIFSVEAVCDLGDGEPLFANFTFEDWAMLSLRFELHLLVHSFMRDCNDSERTGVHPEHLAFYYNKYYKKGLSPKNYGVETIEELAGMVRDTVIICAKVMESQLIHDLDSNEIFVKLTEESRRERQRRIDSGDMSAVIKFPSPPDHGLLSLGAGRTAVRPSITGSPVTQHPQQQMQQQQMQHPQHQQQQQQQQQSTPIILPGNMQRPRLFPQTIPNRGFARPQAPPQQQQQQQQQQQWYGGGGPRTVYGMRGPAAMAHQQQGFGGRGGPYQTAWRYNR